MATRRLLAIAFLLAGFAPAMADDTGSNAAISGEADYRMYCAECHGDGGKGDGPKSFALAKPVTDLTKLTRKYGSFPTDKLMQTVDGRNPLEGHMDREMPLWGTWFKMEAGEDLGGAEGDEATIGRRIANLVSYLEGIQE